MCTQNSKYFAVGLLAILMAALGGCAPTITVQSNMDPNYQVRMKKAFVVLDTRKLDDATRRINYSGNDFNAGVADTVEFTDHFLEALTLSFAAVDVDFKVYRFTGLELSESEITDRARDYQADALLWITEDWFSVMRDEGFFGLGSTQEVMAIDLNTFIYPAEMLDGTPVWRATLEIESGRGGMTQMARELASSLVAKLVSDGLIVPEIVQKSSGMALLDIPVLRE